MSLSALGLPVAAIAKPPTGDKLKIDIEASIGERCGIMALGPTTRENSRIDQASSVAFDFRLDCNAPFHIGVAARNGGLQLAGSTTAQASDGFATRKRYQASLQFQTDQDGLVDAGECEAAALTSANNACSFFGDNPGQGFSPGRQTTAIGRDGSLTVSWTGDDAEAARFAAGTYEEVLTIVVGPRT
jgi:hypothetical protein